MNRYGFMLALMSTSHLWLTGCANSSKQAGPEIVAAEPVVGDSRQLALADAIIAMRTDQVYPVKPAYEWICLDAEGSIGWKAGGLERLQRRLKEVYSVVYTDVAAIPMGYRNHVHGGGFERGYVWRVSLVAFNDQAATLLLESSTSQLAGYGFKVLATWDGSRWALTREAGGQFG